MMEKNTWIVALLGSLLLMSCGIQPPTPNQTCTVNCDDDTINLTGPKTSISVSSSTQTLGNNIAATAKVSASAYHEVAAPVNVKDGFIVNNPIWNEHKFTNWVVRDHDIDRAWIKLEWSTPVNIESIRLFDEPGPDHQVTAGQIQFELWDAGNPVPHKSFSNPVDGKSDGSDADDFLSVEGPGNSLEIRSVKILIFSHSAKSIHAGFSEIQVIGKSVESRLTDYELGMNIAPFSKVKNVSSVLKSNPANPMTGLYGSFFAADNNPDTLWASLNGIDSFIEFELDKSYCISAVIIPKETLFDPERNKVVIGWEFEPLKFKKSNIIRARVVINNTHTFENSKVQDNKHYIEIDPTKVHEVKSIKLEFPSLENDVVAIDEAQFITCK